METLVKTPPGNHDGSMHLSPRLISYLLNYPSKKRKKSRVHKKVNVFIVDDDILYLKALQLSLSSNIDSVEIHSFQTGEDCLKQMKKKPTVVILDYYLNSKIANAMNGISILKQIKKLNPKTKVIMLSSQDSLNIAIDCMDNGAYDYISKTQTALLRINNIITNIVGDIEVTSLFFIICELVVLASVIAFIVYGLLRI